MATILVVGADRGIAHAASLQLLARGDRVIAACLGRGEDLAAKGCEVVGELGSANSLGRTCEMPA